MLRNQVPESVVEFADPIYGVNLRDAQQDLIAGEAVIMHNTIRDGGVRLRPGSIRITPSALNASKPVRGGIKYYFGGATPQNQRIIAYDTKISKISDTGVETVIGTGMTSDLDTYFTNWPITAILYITNVTDTPRTWDGTTFATLSGTNIPVPRTGFCPCVDRLFAITTNGIEVCNPRDPTIWSLNSSWATYRPSQPGLFTAMWPLTIKGIDTFYQGILAFTPNAYYQITGTNFGNPVTSGASTAGFDGAIKQLDPNVGSISPRGIETVPGIGTFFITTDLNVYLLPEGTLTGKFVGDKIRSTGPIAGIESGNVAQMSQAWMRYFNRYLVVGFPTGGNSFSTIQYWLDIRSLIEHPDRGYVWYGPMDTTTSGKWWVENQQGDNSILGMETNPNTGAFIYRMMQQGVFSDAVGLVDTPLSGEYQPYFEDGGYPSRQKKITSVYIDMSIGGGSPTMDLYDLNGIIAADVPIQQVT